MARFTFKLPDIGEGISEAEIVAWHVAVGDRVEEDQQIADMMTDKATVEMESPVSGVVVELAGEVGDQVSIGAALVVIETEEAAGGELVSAPLDATDRPEAESAEEEAFEAENPGVEEARSPAEAGIPASDAGRDAQSAVAKTASAVPPPSPGNSDAAESHPPILASPAVRARASDLGIDLATVKTDGDRVRHADLDAYLRYGSA